MGEPEQPRRAGSAAPAQPRRVAGPPIPQAFTVAAVARSLGVAPATLRTWDRRYGLGPSRHTAGSHRRYTTEDLARLSLMRRFTLSGVPPAEAAEMALREPLTDTDTDTGADAGTGGAGSPGADGDAATPTRSGAPADPPARRRAGGGRVVALPDAEPAARGLARAAMALDTGACSEIVRSHLAQRGVRATWEELLVPVLAAVGERWAVTGQGIDVEHALSECIMAALRTAEAVRPHAGPMQSSLRPALLAGAEREEHVLTLHVLAAALAEQGVPTRLLGGRVPREALAAAVRRSGPAAVFIWSQLPATGDAGQLSEIPALRPAPRIVVGGPGWRRDRLPPSVHLVDTLDDAVTSVLAAAGR